MEESTYLETKHDLILRLKKIEGQVKGLQRMVEDEKYCVDVLVQVAAVRAAINKVGTMVLEHHTRGCLKRAVTDEERDAALEELIKVLTKFTK